jgi:hypothetical protein
MKLQHSARVQALARHLARVEYLRVCPGDIPGALLFGRTWWQHFVPPLGSVLLLLALGVGEAT